jgi:hypothetical protein
VQRIRNRSCTNQITKSDFKASTIYCEPGSLLIFKPSLRGYNKSHGQLKAALPVIIVLGDRMINACKPRSFYTA